MKTSKTYYPAYKNHELILDLTLGAFSIYDISCWGDDQSPGLIDYFIFPEFTYIEKEEPVVDNDGVIVLDSNGTVVTTTIVTEENFSYTNVSNPQWTSGLQYSSFHDSPVLTDNPRHEVVSFLYFYQYAGVPSFGLSRYTYRGFRDWEELIDIGWYGFSYNSYMITGYNLTGDMARNKQAIYLNTYCRRTEEYYSSEDMMFGWLGANTNWVVPSACWVSSRWDWNEDNTQGKFGSEFNVYRFTKPYPQTPAVGDLFLYGDTVIHTKNKLRGRGHALSLLFNAEWGKDMKLLGWNLLANVNGEP